jgi:hypothetical protein
MRTVLVGLLILSGCTTYQSTAPQYEKICDTANRICLITNLLCSFRSVHEQTIDRAALWHELDSLTTVFKSLQGNSE